MRFLILLMFPVQLSTAVYTAPAPEKLHWHDILTVSAAVSGIDKALVLKILWHESRFKAEAVSGTKDYGIAQLHYKTLKGYGLTTEAALSPETSIIVAIDILARLKRRYKASEPQTWWCRYNTGYRHYDSMKDQCHAYMAKVEADSAFLAFERD